MKDLCEGLPTWGHVVVWFAIFFWEFFVGKTKFGSSLEFIIEKLLLIKAKVKDGEKK